MQTFGHPQQVQPSGHLPYAQHSKQTSTLDESLLKVSAAKPRQNRTDNNNTTTSFNINFMFSIIQCYKKSDLFLCASRNSYIFLFTVNYNNIYLSINVYLCIAFVNVNVLYYILYILYQCQKMKTKTLCSIYFFYCLDNILERSAVVISVQYNCIFQICFCFVFSIYKFLIMLLIEVVRLRLYMWYYYYTMMYGIWK